MWSSIPRLIRLGRNFNAENAVDTEITKQEEKTRVQLNVISGKIIEFAIRYIPNSDPVC